MVADGHELQRLGEQFEPTKRRHNYLEYYWLHFRDIREKVTNVMEIGVQTDRSVRMWEAFFPNATIHGLDIDPACKAHEGGRRVIHIGSQDDPEFLRRVVAQIDGPLDIVIDDGSHRPDHQLTSFEVLFPLLSDHGIYVVEDTGGVVADHGLETVRALQRLVDKVMYWPTDVRPEDWPTLSSMPEADWASRNIIGVAFYRWIAFVMKGRNPEDNPYLGA